jgi:hypothetical protein
MMVLAGKESILIALVSSAAGEAGKFNNRID